MPYKPPICPAYAQSQCLTLSPIPEAKSKVNSPVLSITESDKSSLFSGFGWSSASEGLSPLFNEQPQTFSDPGGVAKPSSSGLTGTMAAIASGSISSPAFLQRLQQLKLSQQGSNGNMPSISSTLSLVHPTPLHANNLSPGLAGLGFTFIDAPSQPQVSATGTPFNTPARPPAPGPIVTMFDPSLVHMKLIALNSPPLTPPYDEDNAEDNTMGRTDEVVPGEGTNMDEENTPLDVWVQYRIEESKRREEYERELNEVLLSESPVSIKATSDVTPAENPDEPVLVSHPRESSNRSDDAEDDSSDEDSDSAIVLVSDAKRFSVRDSCAMATLKRKSRLMGLHKEAGSVSELDLEGLPEDSMDVDVDEFGVRMDIKEEMDETEVAMNEDRSSLKYSIFSPTSRLPARRSVSFAQPEVTQVKTFSSSSTTNKHKRKASVTSLFSSGGSTDTERTMNPAVVRIHDVHARRLATRSGRSLSTGCISTTASNIPSNTGPSVHNQSNYHKRARRSSSLASSLAFTSNSLTPIFSSAFIKSMGNASTDKTQPDTIANVKTPQGFHDAPEAILQSLKDTIRKPDDKSNMIAEGGTGTDENKENPSRIRSARPPAPNLSKLVKKRSFGMNLSLSFRGKS